jgi:hypothetical protein
MATTTQSAALVPTAPIFTNTERLALAGFLAGHLQFAAPQLTSKLTQLLRLLIAATAR